MEHTFWKAKRVGKYLLFSSLSFYFYFRYNDNHRIHFKKESKKRNRADRRRVKRKWIKRRWRNWMENSYFPGEFSKGRYFGRGCYCSRCINDRIKWKNVEKIIYKHHINEFRKLDKEDE